MSTPQEIHNLLKLIKESVEEIKYSIISIENRLGNLECYDENIQLQCDELKKSNQFLVDTIDQLRKRGKL